MWIPKVCVQAVVLSLPLIWGCAAEPESASPSQGMPSSSESPIEPEETKIAEPEPDKPKAGTPPRKRAPISGPKQRLQKFQDTMRLPDGTPLIERIDLERGFATMYMNPSVWNGISRMEQRQLLDQIANSTIMERLVSMRIYVRSTYLGKINANAFGGGFEFEPSEAFRQ